MRPTSRRLRRRKAVSEASLPGSGHSSSSADDRHLPFTTPGPPPAGNGVEKSFRESPSDSASAGALVLGGDANRQLSAMTFRGDSTRA